MLPLPFDPTVRSSEIEKIVMRGNSRRYYRFRYALYYGGICTSDAVGCNFLCAYCWNYFKNENPETAKYLGYFTPKEVAAKLNGMGKSHDCHKYRISGSEPFLGIESTKHIVEIIKSVPRSDRFIIETNAFMLGFDQSLIALLKGCDNALFRIAVKADNEKTFEQITGCKEKYQPYQLEAIKALRDAGLSVSVAYMDDFVNPVLLGLDFNEDFDCESLSTYRGTKSRLKARGLLIDDEEVKKPVFNHESPNKPKSVTYWEAKGDDIT